jgi:hypothetical protein
MEVHLQNRRDSGSPRGLVLELAEENREREEEREDGELRLSACLQVALPSAILEPD